MHCTTDSKREPPETVPLHILQKCYYSLSSASSAVTSATVASAATAAITSSGALIIVFLRDPGPVDV